MNEHAGVSLAMFKALNNSKLDTNKKTHHCTRNNTNINNRLDYTQNVVKKVWVHNKVTFVGGPSEKADKF